MDRRSFMAGCAGLPFLAGHARAQSGPLTKVVFPFAAGGSGDLLTRLVAEHLRPALDRSVIVENRTGGDGLIAIKSVMNSAPDGTTILITTGPTMYLLPMVEEKPSFDHAKDFVPVSPSSPARERTQRTSRSSSLGSRPIRRKPRSACRAAAPFRISPGRGSSRHLAFR